MRTDDLIDAIGEIDASFVQEAETWRRPAKKRFRAGRFLPVAACLALLFGGALALWKTGKHAGDGMSGGMESADVDGEDSADAVDMGAEDGFAADPGEAQDADAQAGAAGGAGAEAQDASAQDGSSGASANVQGSGEEGLLDAGNAPGRAEGTPSNATGGAMEESILAEEDSAPICVNEIQEIQVSNIDIAAADRVEVYTAEGLEGYYGVRVIPEKLPRGLTPVFGAEESFSVGYDREGKVIYDNNELGFSGASGGRTLRIAVRTVDAGEIVSFADSDLVSSSIYGTEAVIGHYMDGDKELYLVLFEKGGVRFTVQSENLKEAEVLGLLDGLLGQ